MNQNTRNFVTPTGGNSSIEVSPQPDGRGIDFIFKRSSAGELFLRLSWSQAENLGKDIASLVAARSALPLNAEGGDK